MSSGHMIVLIDDGDLGQVADLLDEIGVEYSRESGKNGTIPPQPGIPLVTTSHAAIYRKLGRGKARSKRGAVWIAFVTGGSKTERASLERAGFDFLVRQPVHPAALRLLLLHALYQGKNKRGTNRLAFGYEVRFGGRLFSRRGTLTDLSPQGCRLLAMQSPERGAHVSVTIPKEAAGGRALRLAGRVVRTAAGDAEGGDPKETSVGIEFNELGRAARKRLDAILLERSSGPAVLPQMVTPQPAPGDTRQHVRVEFTQKLNAVASSNAHVVLGRDLSEGGMRIDADSLVKVGDELFLAIQSPGNDTFFVEGCVVRDDGAEGLAVQFGWIEPGAREQLQSLVGSLPPIERLTGGGAGAAAVAARWLGSVFRRS